MTLEELVQLPAVELAPRLIGWRLVREDGEERSVVEIHETEAYPGGSDRASHTRGGLRTQRNASMWLPGGHLYVFLIYGMHHCLNVVSGPEGAGEAVLIRSGRPLEGLDCMMERRRPGAPERELCLGPGRLAEALGVDRGWDGMDLRAGARLHLEPPVIEQPCRVRSGRRVGVESSGPSARLSLRYALDGSSWCSRPPIEGPLLALEGGLAQENARSR